MEAKGRSRTWTGGVYDYMRACRVCTTVRENSGREKVQDGDERKRQDRTDVEHVRLREKKMGE